MQVIDQGVPDDAMPAYKNGHERLPDVPLFGMVNKYRSKVGDLWKAIFVSLSILQSCLLYLYQ